MKIGTYSLISSLVFLSVIGCAASGPVNVVADAKGVHHYGGFDLSCSKPVEMTRDCSYMSGGTRLIVIGQTDIKIAGSEDGKTIWIRDPATTSLTTGFRSAAMWTSNTNTRYHVVKEALLKRGIHVQHVVPVVQAGMVLTYIITFDGDAYSVLEEFTKTD